MSGEKFKKGSGSKVPRTSTLIRDRPDRGEEEGNVQKKNQTDLLQPRCMMMKLDMISGLFQAILFTIITWNPESNCTCRERHHTLFSEMHRCTMRAIPGVVAANLSPSLASAGNLSHLFLPRVISSNSQIPSLAPGEEYTMRPQTNSNDFGVFWNLLRDSNSIFVAAEIIFLNDSIFWCVQSSITCNETVHMPVLWPVCTHTIPFRMLWRP